MAEGQVEPTGIFDDAPSSEGSASIFRDEKPAKKKKAPPRVTAAKAERLAAVREQLTQHLTTGYALLTPFSPTAAVVGIERAPASAEKLCVIAARNPKFLKRLEDFLAATTVFSLGEDFAAVGVAVACDRGAMNPHSRVAQVLGVEKAYEEVHPEDETNTGEPDRPPSLLAGLAGVPN